METITQIAEIFKHIVESIVDYPDKVLVSPIQDREGFVLKITVVNNDIGKVIGKQGRTARSLRTIAQALSMKYRIPIALDITDGALRIGPRD